MISWPGVIQHADDPELDYLETPEAFEISATGSVSAFDENTLFIDSEGHVYELHRTDSGATQLRDTGKRQTLEQVLGLVKAHAAHAEHCCIAKLWAPTIRDAISIVRSVSEENG